MTRNALKEWNKNVFGNLKVRKDRLENQLAKVQKKHDGEKGSIEQCKKEREIRRELEDLVEQDQILWMQKSRTNQIIQANRNTKYYHTVTARKDYGTELQDY